jgi:hypothetical protein
MEAFANQFQPVLFQIPRHPTPRASRDGPAGGWKTAKNVAKYREVFSQVERTFRGSAQARDSAEADS